MRVVWPLLIGTALHFSSATASPQTRQKLNYFDRSHEAISSQINLLSNRLDTLFGNPGDGDLESGSRVRLNLGSKYTDYVGDEYAADIQAYIRLPYLQNRLNLVIENFDEGETKEDTVTNADIRQNPSDQNRVGAALRYYLKKNRDWDINLDGGVNFNFPTDPFAKLKLKRSFDLKPWEFKILHQIYWLDSEGLGTFGDLIWDYRLNDRWLFRTDTSGSWKAIEDTLHWGQSFSLFHRVSRIKAFIYQMGLTGRNDPVSHVDNYFFGIKFRQRIYKKWVIFEVEPRADYPEEESFRPFPSIAFRFEFLFGDI